MQDPFAGRQRLNQLTPQELLTRNDRMSGQVQAKEYTKDMSQEQIDEENRNWYRMLSSARIEATATQKDKNTTQLTPEMVNGQYGPTVPGVLADQKVTNGNSTGSSALSTPGQLPFGWGERLNQTPPISNIKASGDTPLVPATSPTQSQSTTTTQPLSSNNDKKLTVELTDAGKQISDQRKKIDMATKLYILALDASERDEELITHARDSLNTLRANFLELLSVEAQILKQLEQK